MSANFGNSPVDAIRVQLTDSAGLAMFITAPTASVPNAVAGYAKGCVCMNETTGLGYMNTGTATSCTFTAFNSASALTLPSAFTDSTTTDLGLAISYDAITTGTGLKLINGNTTNFTTNGELFWAEMSAAVAGNGVKVTTSAAYTGTGLIIATAGAMATGTLCQLTSTTGLTSGSVLAVTSSTAGALTAGIVKIYGAGDYTSNTAGALTVSMSGTTAGTLVQIVATAVTTGKALHITAAAAYTGTGLITVTPAALTTGVAMVITLAAITTGKGLSIASTGAGQTTHTLLELVQTTTTTGYTGAIQKITSSSTTGAGYGLLITMVNTTAGDGIKINSNALTLGAGTAINVAHTTSVLGAGTSLVRISSTGVDTGTTTGTLLDLSQSAADGNVAVLLTDSSADVSARSLIKVNITNAAAVGAVPLDIKSVAVAGSNSKFKKIAEFGGVTLWVGIDAGGNTANGQLTATAGDICFNGGSNKPEYCTGTNVWVALV